MLWNLLLILTVVGLAALWFWSAKIQRPNAYTGRDYFPAGCATVFVGGALLITSCIGTGINESDYSVYGHSTELVTMKQGQRDELAGIIKDQLSSDQYAALMAATPKADLEVLLGGNHAVTDIMLERSRTLVGLNADVNDLVNRLEKKRINLCAWAENPLTPRLFMTPHCPAPLAVALPGVK